MKRKQFFKTSILGGTAFFINPRLNASSFQDVSPLDKALVKDFVGKSHRDLNSVKEMLKEHPTLLNAAHDWGNGDFETGLGAASHVGYIELAQYLIDKGAQTNIFTACLFGQLDLVKSILDVFPHSLDAKGPHGFTLLHHAIVGKAAAEGVRSYLESLGAVETKIPLY